MPRFRSSHSDGSLLYAVRVMLLFAFLSAAALQAQDSAVADAAIHYSLRLHGGTFYHTDVNDRSVRVPEYFRQQSSGYITDNPLFHGAMYNDFEFQAGIGASITARVHVVAEHRGQSYGVFNTREMIVFPRAQIAVDTGIQLGGEVLRLGGAVGNFDDLRLHEGLLFDHFDSQGARWYIGWRYFSLMYNKTGDAEYGFGLGINDVDDYILAMRDLPLAGNFTLSASAGPAYLTGISTAQWAWPWRYNAEIWNYSAALAYGGDARLYAQYAVRSGAQGNGSAALAGLSLRYNEGPFALSCTGEYRIYRDRFNLDLTSSSASYRSHDRNSAYDNTIGDFLYPLYLLDRPFSQWAVYTEYQGLDVRAWVLQAAAHLRLWHGVGVSALIDLTDVQAGAMDSFTYPFFDIGVDWMPFRGVQFLLSWTNKGMNLDKSYPTFYLYNTAVTSLTARWDFGFGTLQR